jgi:hypothetical protein
MQDRQSRSRQRNWRARLFAANGALLQHAITIALSVEHSFFWKLCTQSRETVEI